MAVLHRVWFAGVLLSMVAIAWAQGPDQGPPGRRPQGEGSPGGPMHGGPPLVMLAAQKSVEADLKCSKSQRKRIQALAEKMQKLAGEAMQAGPQGMGGGPQVTPGVRIQGMRPPPPGGQPGPQGMNPPPQGMGGKMESAQRDAEKELAEDPQARTDDQAQAGRLQIQGPQALLAPELAEKLQLTEEQVGKIKGLTRKQDKEAQQPF